MPKRERGLPSGLAISVPAALLEPKLAVAPPLRDFLDSAIAEKEAAEQGVDSGPEATSENTQNKESQAPPRPRLKRRVWPQPSAVRQQAHANDDGRLQLRMSPEVSKTLDDLVAHFARFGPNKRVPASDIIGVLILGLGDALGELDLAGVPRRGAYGSPSADAHRVHMKDAVTEAIRRQRAKDTADVV